MCGSPRAPRASLRNDRKGDVGRGVRCSLVASLVADTRVAQHLLSHARLGTTAAYLDRPRLDDMVAAVKDATYGVRTNILGVAQSSKQA
jgi:hypothetical protein